MVATITLTTAPTVRHRFARTATLATIRMPVRLTDTGDLTTSWTACSSELARGMDGDSVADFAVTADSVADFMMVADLVADLIVVGSLDAGSMVGRDLEIGQASPTAAEVHSRLCRRRIRGGGGFRGGGGGFQRWRRRLSWRRRWLPRRWRRFPWRRWWWIPWRWRRTWGRPPVIDLSSIELDF